MRFLDNWVCSLLLPWEQWAPALTYMHRRDNAKFWMRLGSSDAGEINTHNAMTHEIPRTTL